MPAHNRKPTTDEELGKRDDDFKPRRRATSISSYMPWQWRRRRLAVVLILSALAFYAFYNNYTPDLETIKVHLPELPPHLNPSLSDADGPASPVRTELLKPVVTWSAVEEKEAVSTGEATTIPLGDLPDVVLGSEDAQHFYEGKIKFYELRAGLDAIAHTNGLFATNRNVFFAASSLRSAANILPMACEMARMGRNHVHFGLFGRNTLTVDEVLGINGLTKESCTVTFIDARPDYAEYSTDGRAEWAVTSAMTRINEKMHPQAVIIDSKDAEDVFFVRAMQTSVGQLFKPLIDIPFGSYDDFLWITRLDSSSLTNWFTPTVDIVVQAPHGSTGGLKRLLASLKAADFTGLRHPRLTIELSSHVPLSLRHYLDNYHWPPIAWVEPTPRPQSMLTLRHRLPNERLTSEQSAIRFVESFYPASPADSYMLILSPQAEVSPQFFQYVHYALLEYRYSAWGQTPQSQTVMGIALNVPEDQLDGKESFIQPSTVHLREADTQAVDDGANIAYQIQAPSSGATLIFGEKWLTFHDFLAKRIHASQVSQPRRSPKFVTETEPSWLEYLLELMRARGWAITHPPSSFVTLHDDLAQLPEEFVREPTTSSHKSSPTTTVSTFDDGPFILASEPPVLIPHRETDLRSDPAPLHALLPGDGTLLPLRKMPVLAYTGALLPSENDVKTDRDNYIVQFRMDVGGCSENDARRARLADLNTADDLFCLPGGNVRFADEV